MRVKNGYVWSDKYQCWRKLPRRVWLEMQRQKSIKQQSVEKRADCNKEGV